VYKQSPAMINISNNPIANPARSTLQGIANRDVPIIVFHIAKLKITIPAQIVEKNKNKLL